MLLVVLLLRPRLRRGVLLPSPLFTAGSLALHPHPARLQRSRKPLRTRQLLTYGRTRIRLVPRRERDRRHCEKRRGERLRERRGHIRGRERHVLAVARAVHAARYQSVVVGRCGGEILQGDRDRFGTFALAGVAVELGAAVDRKSTR